MSFVVGFAGLSHLGLISAVATASKGFTVVGYDPQQNVVDALDEFRWPVVEPGLDELARQHNDRLSWSIDPGALGRCDIVFVSADVPTGDAGESDLAPIEALIRTATLKLRPDAILVVLSQVPPGFTRNLPFPAERRFYQVETLIFGRAVERATQPERFIVGCAEPERLLPNQYLELLQAFGCPILPMRYESAELCKISINCCLVASLTVANTLAELSERIGADWYEIAQALRLDARIGPQAYLAPGLGIAGGNLERDLATVRRLAEEVGSDAGLIDAFVSNSHYRRDWALRVLHERILATNPKACIAVLGLAYKENTASTKNSPGLALIESLRPWQVRAFDPVVPISVASHPRIKGAVTALETVQGCDALVIMTPWPEFRRLEPMELAKAITSRLVIDPYRILDPAACRRAGVEQVVLGKGSD